MCLLLLLADALKNSQKGFYGKACNTEVYAKRIIIKVREKNRQKKDIQKTKLLHYQTCHLIKIIKKFIFSALINKQVIRSKRRILYENIRNVVISF